VEFVLAEVVFHVTVAPESTPLVAMLVTVPVTVPGVLVAVANVKLAVVVFPPITVTFWVTLWYPVAEATSWTVPTGMAVKLYTPAEFVVAVPPPKLTVAPLMGALEELATVPVTFPTLEIRVMAGTVVVLPAVTVTLAVAGWYPAADAFNVTVPAGTLLRV
jgi:hypothetical protein